jgi:hypothetical protein
MAYEIENGFVQFIDRVGTSTANPIPAPEAGNTLLYTTPQGLVAEQSAATWYMDKPVSLTLVGAGAAITGTDTYATILTAPFTIPNTVESDSSTTTTYCIDINFGYTFTGAAGRFGFLVFLNGSGGILDSTHFVDANGAVTTTGTANIRYWFTGASGDTLDVQVKTLNAGDSLSILAAATQPRVVLVRRDFSA